MASILPRQLLRAALPLWHLVDLLDDFLLMFGFAFAGNFVVDFLDFFVFLGIVVLFANVLGFLLLFLALLLGIDGGPTALVEGELVGDLYLRSFARPTLLLLLLLLLRFLLLQIVIDRVRLVDIEFDCFGYGQLW